MLLVILGVVVERVDPIELLRHLAFDRPIVFPSRLEPQPADGRLVLARDQHVPKRRRHGLRGRRPVRQFRQRDENIDQQILGVSIVGIVVSGEMKVRSIDRALRATDPEQLGERLKKRGLAGRVRADHRSDFGAEGHGNRIGAETAEAGERDAFKTQGRNLQAWRKGSRITGFRAAVPKTRPGLIR